MPLKPGSKTPHRHSASSSSSPNPKKEKHHKKSPNPNPSPSPSSPNPHHPKPPPPPPSPAPSMSRDGPESSRKRPHNQMDDEDAITILNAVVDFRANHAGSGPTPTTMKPVYDAVKDNLHQEITFDQLYNKFRCLKHRYSKAVESGVGPTPFDRLFFDLSVRAWGEKKPKDAFRGGFETTSNIKKSSSKKPKIEENGYGQEAAENGDEEEDAAAASADDAEVEDDGGDEENEDFSDSFKLLIDEARKHWEKEGMSFPALELGLKFVDKSKAVNLEKRWRQHFEAEWKMEAKTIEVKKDFLTSLCAVQKDASL